MKRTHNGGAVPDTMQAGPRCRPAASAVYNTTSSVVNNTAPVCDAAAPAVGNTLTLATDGLRALCDSAGIDASHGIDHALTVLGHLEAAVAVAPETLPASRVLAMRLAALLHDADDKKYWKTANYANAAAIMAKAGAAPAVIDDAVRMISLVSCSANGNSCPADAAAHPELLWPRWADRLEAVGEVGVVRCYLFNKKKGEPMSSESTPRPQTWEEALALATDERFAKYQASGGASASMIDHYYDKLLQVARPPPELVCNRYLEEAGLQGAEPLLRICQAYGETGEVPLSMIESLASKLGMAD